jgi:hypothetical protein
MDGQQFDTLAKALGGLGSRRRALGGFVAGALALVGGPEVTAKNCNKIKDKKKRKQCKKKAKGNKGTCLTLGGPTTCPSSMICCDPQLSTGGGCAPPDAPVCCLSNLLAYPVGATCCGSPFAGNGGACIDSSHPHCCTPNVTGCCEAGFPVCCNDPIVGGAFCCPAGTFCCPDTPEGCCIAQAADLGAETVETVPRGTHRSASSRSSEERPRFEPLA